MNKKLTLRDKAILSVLVLAAFVYAGYNYLYIPATQDIGGLHEQIEELSGKDFTHLDGKLETLEAENTDGLKVIEEIKTAETGNSFNSQMFLIFLSSICDKNGINLVKFNELGQNEQEGIWNQRYDFELCGNIGSINQVIGSIDGLKVKYSINSMSFRQNNNYSFLERLFDGISKLEWYTDPIPEPEETEEVEEPTENEELPELQELIPPAEPAITPIPPYICMMLNYVLIQYYERFRIDHVFKINKEALDCFFRDYAQEELADGKYRGKPSVEKCVYAVTEFFRQLRREFGNYVLLTQADLYTENTVQNKYGKIKTKRLPTFQVKGIPKTDIAFRELPTKAFKILLNLAFRYAPDIAFAICLQAFAGLRAGEVLNVRQEGCPMGGGLIFTKIESRTIKVEIDLRREVAMRSDDVICGRIKRERRQCVYPPFLSAFVTAYEHHKRFLSMRTFEKEYCPMFTNNRGMAMTYVDYSRRFAALVDNHFRPVLLGCEDPECRIYGQLLYENRLGLHALRHWYSVQLVLHGEDIAQIQYWRGDKNPESAFTYLQNKGDLSRELECANDFLTEILMEQGEMEANARQR